MLRRSSTTVELKRPGDAHGRSPKQYEGGGGGGCQDKCEAIKTGWCRYRELEESNYKKLKRTVA